MNKPSKSKAETVKIPKDLSTNPWGDPKVSQLGRDYCRVNNLRLGRTIEQTDIITRMEASQARFGSFPSLLQSAEDERREHENDLRHESLMADESEYGPRCNLRDEVGSRQ